MNGTPSVQRMKYGHKGSVAAAKNTAQAARREPKHDEVTRIVLEYLTRILYQKTAETAEDSRGATKTVLVGGA